MSVRRSWTALFTALLLLVPLAIGAHVHESHADQACAACVVTHHAPAIRADAPTVAPPTVLASTSAPSADEDALVGERPAHAGRGPPARFPRSVH